MLTLLLFFLLTSFVLWTTATHFRGAHFWFRPTADWSPSSQTVEIGFRLEWRQDYSTTTRCSQQLIESGQLMGPETPGFLMCLEGCSATPGIPVRVSDVSIRCKGFSELENWMYGVRSYVFTFPPNVSRQYILEWIGDGWFVNDLDWDMRTTLNTSVRRSTGRMNASPRALLPNIPLAVQLGCSMEVSLNVVDDDGDDVRCRWADSSKDECASVCHDTSDIILNETACTVRYTDGMEPSVGVIAIQLEDFSTGNILPLSSVPLQVNVAIYAASSAPCNARPNIISPSPSTCLTPVVVHVDYINSYWFLIVARSKDTVTRIPILAASSESPDVIISSSDVTVHEDSATDYAINVTVSAAGDVTTRSVSAAVCLQATDDFGRLSEQVCLNVSFGPDLVPRATKAEYNNTDNRVTIYFDQLIQRSSDIQLIGVYNSSNDQRIAVYDTTNGDQVVLRENTIVVKLPNVTAATIGSTFYILLPQGAVKSSKMCGIGSAAVANTSLLLFDITAADMSTSLTTTTPFLGDDSHTSTTPTTTTTTTTSTTTGGAYSDRTSSRQPLPQPQQEQQSGAWTYRWLIVALTLSAAFIVVVVTIVAMATRHRRRRRREATRRDNDVTAADAKQSQEKYFSSIRTNGYFNWTYDPDDNGVS